MKHKIPTGHDYPMTKYTSSTRKKTLVNRAKDTHILCQLTKHPSYIGLYKWAWRLDVAVPGTMNEKLISKRVACLLATLQCNSNILMQAD